MQPKLLEARDLFPDQQADVETIMEFVEDPSASEMLVEGPAGSGKTSSIRVSINELPKAYRSGVVVCAPTNKAVKVARELSGGLVDTTTIYKLLSLSPQANGEVKEIRQGENAHQKLMATELVYLDEASMNGSVLKPFIRRAQEDYPTVQVLHGRGCYRAGAGYRRRAYRWANRRSTLGAYRASWRCAAAFSSSAASGGK